MNIRSRIEWTETTWNPTTGCDRVSTGCDRCYALTLAARLKAMGSAKYQTDGDPHTSGPGFGITEHPDVLDAPRDWHKPRRIFVNSMSDLFHKGVSDRFIACVFAVMAATPRHTYQLLTKRHGRMRALLSDSRWLLMVADAGQSMGLRDVRALLDGAWPLPNVWLGVSVEDQQRAELRIPALLDTPAAVRFLSCEPLLGPVDLRGWLSDPPDVDGDRWPPSNARQRSFDWVIAGGESGAGARPIDVKWTRDLRDCCTAAGVPFFFKQWGGRTPKAGGRLLDGQTWDQMPDHGAAPFRAVLDRLAAQDGAR